MFLNAPAKQIFCKVAVHGPRATRLVDALASLPGVYAPEDPGFRVVELVPSGYEIASWALRLCVYALDDNDDLGALMRGADAFLVTLDGVDDRARVAELEPYVTARTPVLLVGAQHDFEHPALAVDPSTIEGARAALSALLPRLVDALRAS